MGVDTTVDRGAEATEVNDVRVCVTLAAMIVCVTVFVEVEYIVVVGSADDSAAGSYAAKERDGSVVSRREY